LTLELQRSIKLLCNSFSCFEDPRMAEGKAINYEHPFKKIKLRVDEIQDNKCLTKFHDMIFLEFIRKWQILIDAQVDVKTVA
jgi:hypothetical protein